MTDSIDIYIINCEGAIEEAAKKVYKAMVNKKKTPVNLTFFCTTEYMHKMFMLHLAVYLRQRKAKKVSHVKVDVYIDTGEEG